jgi:acetylornithine/succinyldiaminopimelate/putrescine aminotransferase
MHAATFGGNPIAARAGLATIEMIENEGLLKHATRLGEIFKQRLTELKSQCELVKEVRVLGVMIGLELSIDGTPVVQGCMDERLLVNCTHGTVIRLLPAMNLSEQQVHDGCDILAKVIKQQTA